MILRRATEDEKAMCRDVKNPTNIIRKLRNSACHFEPCGVTQGKLREKSFLSGRRIGKIFRCARHDDGKIKNHERNSQSWEEGGRALRASAAWM